jgi:MYXO-CTERM domain-containing protein
MSRLLIVLALISMTASTVLAQSTDDAFQGFLDALQDSRQLIVEQTEEDGTDRAEGLRHIVRLVEMQNARATDDHDAAHPHVSRCPSLVCKVGFDNPDFTYINVGPISPEYSYRVFGKRGTVPYLSMQVFDNPLGGTEFMTSEDLVVEPDGSYEIILSAEEPEGASNWMKLEDTAFFFILRNGFYDWNDEVEASVQVEVIAGPMSGPVPHLTPTEFEQDMAELSLRIRSIPRSIFGARDGWPTNDLNDPDPGAFGIEGAGIPTAVSSAGRYELGTDEAMIIETPMPDVVHGGIQLGNLWVESIDYQTRQTSLNWFQSTPDSDGIIRYVLAHEDPGVPNWLDISGHPNGGIFMRWQSPSDESYPGKPMVKVVPFDEIAANLPSDHPTVSPVERAEILSQRYIAVNKRRNPTGQFDDVEAESGSGGSGCGVGAIQGESALFALAGLAIIALRRRRKYRRW